MSGAPSRRHGRRRPGPRPRRAAGAGSSRVDITCRAACADQTGKIMWSGHRFWTRAEDLQALWAQAAQRHHRGVGGAGTDPQRLAAAGRVVPAPRGDGGAGPGRAVGGSARLLRQPPQDRPAGRRAAGSAAAAAPRWPPPETTNGPGDPLRRAVELRSGLVRRRSACMQRLDALLEILGPDRVAALGSDMPQTAFKFLAGWANPHQAQAVGRARLARWFPRQTPKAWANDEPTPSSPPPRPPWPCGTRWPGRPGPGRRHRHRGQPRPGALTPDRPPR